MRCQIIVVSMVAVAVFGIAAATDLPDFIHVCKRNDPDLNTCVTNSVDAMKPYMMKGVPEYDIPSLEPLLLKELSATVGTLTVKTKDVNVYGASDFTVTNMNINLDTLVIMLDVNLPNINIQGLYEVDGKVLLLPIHGNGPMAGNFTNCKGMVTMHAALKKEADGEDHLYFKEFEMTISVGQGTIKLDNLFGGDPVLGDVVNTAINSNFDAFIKELQPLVERALTDAFVKIANSIVSHFTYDQLVPAS